MQPDARGPSISSKSLFYNVLAKCSTGVYTTELIFWCRDPSLIGIEFDSSPVSSSVGEWVYFCS